MSNITLIITSFIFIFIFSIMSINVYTEVKNYIRKKKEIELQYKQLNHYDWDIIRNI